MRRFRPNIIVDAPGYDECPEDARVGNILRIGDVRLRVDRPDKRCVIVNVDPDTGQRDPRMLRAIARERELMMGVYATTVTPGSAAVGDPVVVEG